MNTVPKVTAEPPSSNSTKAHILIGKDSHGHWVVKDEKGLHGGIFVDRVQALKFAMHDLGQRLQAVIMVPGILELDMGGATPAAARIRDKRPAMRRAA
jgi:hypothetical protein